MKLTPQFFLVSVILLLNSITVSAQNIITGNVIDVDKSENTNLNQIISDYDILEIDILRKDIDLNKNSGIVYLNLGSEVLKLSLFSNNLLVSAEGDNIPHLLSGMYGNGSQVSLTINDEFIYGFFKSAQSTRYIEPLWYLEKDAPKNQFVLYDVVNVIEDTEHKCGVTEQQMRTPKDVPYKMTTDCRIVEFAIANTSDMFTKYTNNTGVMNHNLGVLNNVQTNYRSEFNANLEYDVVAHYIPTSSTNDPLQPNTSSTNAGTLLNAFTAWAGGFPAGAGGSAGNNGGFNITFDMASMWTDRDLAGSTIGVAWTPGWFSIFEDYTTSAIGLNVLVSHEIGHNWGAQHVTGITNIMFPSVVATDVWASNSVTSVNNRVNSQSGALSNCSTEGAPIANYFADTGGSATCSGGNVTIEFEDQSQYGATRDWTFLNGSPSASTDAKETVTYGSSVTGLNYIELESTNNAGSSILQSFIDIQAAPGSQCSPSGSGGGGGTTNITFSNVNNSSSASGVYEDFACSDIADLEVSTTYDLSISTNISPTQTQRIRIYADWNDDGDFNDSGEQILNTTFTGNSTFNFSTPASPVLNELIRFRIINSFNNISGPCHSTNFGQTEDYSVYFAGTPVFGCTDATANNYNPNATVDDGSCTFGGGSTTWYEDSDNDNFGNPAVSQSAVNQPAGFVADNTDCDDTDNTVFPGAPEICDGQDNNCNNQIDEGVLNTYYRDFDNDNFGDANNTIDACSPPTGFVTNNTDCDDTDNTVFPGAPEICDGQDNNCNNQIDEGVLNTYYRDFDDDNFGNPNNTIDACSPPTGWVTDNTDCDDTDNTVFPGAPEICDGQDNNCNNQIDEGLLTTYYRDNDNDNFGDANNTVDACSPPTGFVTDNTDCDDTDNTVFPGAPELCDGQDNNCNNQIDEGVLNTYYRDLDGDNFGNPFVTLERCSPPSGYVSDNTDCDDTDNTVFPGAPELCDGLDNNCNNQIDEGALITYYRDLDNDGFGDPNTTAQDCNPPSGFVTNDDDCDDDDSNINPAANDVCGDNIDNNCDGIVDFGCQDCDGVNLVITNGNIMAVNRAQQTIDSDALVNLNSVIFAAGGDINLNSSFEVDAGSVFEARIEPCVTNAQEENEPDSARNSDSADVIEDIKQTFSNSENVHIDVTKESTTVISLNGQHSEIYPQFIEQVKVLNSGRYILKIVGQDQTIEKTLTITQQ